MNLSKHRMIVLFVQLMILATFLAAWEFLPRIKVLQESTHLLDPFFISAPSRIVTRLSELMTGTNGSPLIWPYVFPTVAAAITGIVIGVLFGAFFGLLLSASPFLSDVFRPFVVAANAVPRVALIPIVVIFVGPTFQSSVIISVMVVFFVAFFNAYEGGRTVAPHLIQNAADADRLRPEMKKRSAFLQLALEASWTVSHAQIIEPGRAVVTFNPHFGISHIASNVPPIGAVALAAQLHLLHQGIECARLGRIDTIFDLNHDRSAASRDRQDDFRIGKQLGSVGISPVNRGDPPPQSQQRRRQQDHAGEKNRLVDVNETGQMSPAPAAQRDTAGHRSLKSGQRAARDPARA
jgi:hypothetical protein